MALREKIEKLAKEKSEPCVTISLNTHRTHPDSAKDGILLKNLLAKAESRVIDEYSKRYAASLLERIKNVADKIDINYNSDSLHIFLSNDTEEIIKISWPIPEDRVIVGDSFDLRSLIKSYSRVEEYLVLLLSQGGVFLYEALNDCIESEIQNEDFPFTSNPHFIADAEKRSDSKRVDNKIREYFNTVDKAAVKVSQQTGLKCVVISTEENFSYLMEVADRPDIYIGHAPIDYNRTGPHNIVLQSWGIIKSSMFERIKEAIEEMKEAISQSKVITDVKEIYQAAIDGRGDMLIVYEGYSQPARLIDDRTIQLTGDIGQSDVEDITSNIVWNVLSQSGRVFFTQQEAIKDLGEIVMKIRY